VLGRAEQDGHLVERDLGVPADLRGVPGAFDPVEASGWPVLASYGMSECASTIAIEEDLLSHIEARRQTDGRLAFRPGWPPEAIWSEVCLTIDKDTRYGHQRMTMTIIGGVS